MDDETALKRLRTLLKEDDALKIILPFHACASDALVLDQHVAENPAGDLGQACKTYANEHGHTPNMPGGYREPAHYRQVAVKRIEEAPQKEGLYIAYADDGEAGSRVAGRPAALLARLTEHERA
jgi:hypothetical protein